MSSPSKSDEDSHMDFHDAASAASQRELSCGSSPRQHLELPRRFAGLLKYVDSSQDEDTNDSTLTEYQLKALANAPIFTAEAYDVVDGVLEIATSTTVSVF